MTPPVEGKKTFKKNALEGGKIEATATTLKKCHSRKKVRDLLRRKSFGEKPRPKKRENGSSRKSFWQPLEKKKAVPATGPF